ncbi:Telomere length regulator protein [Trichophyton interdigitale]|uniref:Telomere length regulator protein n=1 Tax=Trichophyton interdigitale TaxID=101480 RepID=A0A9P5CW14_9EURO|nr:Telomere length regulator protein [Trichophyton interdigitale]KAF3893130.1 Telomere length regulator protein [Trichophyton interdigitale]KAG8207939.1 Telomere length regulator protein [Trichophyton interdigitale]
MVDQEIRPPTPPRASSSAIGDASLSADDSIPIVAPTTAFSPSDASPLPLSSSRSKRVNFSPMASYIKPPEFTDHSMKPPTRLRSLPPSSNQSVPAKSILKSRTMISDNIPSDELRSSPSTDLSGMLSSIIEQLSGSSHILRRDAYSQLVGSLSAYCDQPDSNSIIDNIDLFVGWIKRDINTTPSSNDDSDYSLPHQALNLLNMLVFKPETSPRIPDDFKAYILDRAISSIQQNSTPKNIVIDYMRLLSIQNFSPKILTSSRATKLLETISSGPDRVGGKAVTALRLNIYDRLFSQARSIFVSHANFWMDNLIAGLLHKVKDVRLKALQLGFRITDSLGPSTPVFKAIDEVLNLPTDKGKDTKFVNDFCDRLTSMIANRETSLHVPQIWSVVTLLLRSPRWQIEKWSHFKAWMLVIQKCFNCSDLTTNSQALLAWNRLVYVVQQSSESNRGMAKFLFKPIDSQLERRKTSKRGAHTDHAFSSYCNLLYYSFKPGTPYERLDLHWMEYMIAPTSKVLKWSSGNALGLCRILAMLLWDSPKIWDEKKALEATKVGPEDLPRLDCKWVRSRISKILPVFETLFDLLNEQSTSIEDSTAGVAWVHLSRSLADASSKEIQPSTETMEAVGSILESLQRIWKKTGISAVSRAKDGNSIFFNQFLFFVKTIVHSLGSVAFTEKMLLKTSTETFSIAQTPTHRRPHPNGVIRTPLLHLLQYVCLSTYPVSIPRYKSLLHGIIETGIQSRTSRSSRLEILRQFTESLLGPTSEALELNHDSVEEVWKSISAFTKETLATSTPDTNVMGKDETSTRDYDKVLAILERGTRYNIKSLEWSSLFRSLMTVVRNEKGDAQASQFIESFVSHSIRNGISIGFGEIGLFMEAISFPREPATRAQPINLPATTKTSPKPQPFCEKVVSLTNDILLHLYHAQSWECIPDVLTFIDAVSQWLERCPEHYRITLLERLQIGIVPWLSDPSEKLTAESGIDKSILNSARTMTSVTICNITSLRTTNSETLEQLASLMTAGFESRHKSIVNKFISMWNASFGLEKNLSYPASLEAILRRLKPFVEIQLPGFPERTEPESISVPEYLSSQEDVVTPKPVQRPKKDGSERSSSSPDSNTRSRKRKSEQKHDATTPKRPRHDDSQIQFVTVEPEGEMAGPLESQFMTENQKAVRERQRKDAAIMFPEMHSSRPSSRCKTLDPLDSNLPTPTIPPEAPNAVEEVQSSPTPASRSPRTSYTNLDLTSFPSNVEWSFSTNGDPPSSPPQTVPSSQGEPAAHELSCTSPHNAQSSSTKEPSQLTHNNEDEDADSTPRPNSRSKSTVQADPGKEDELVPDSFNDPLQEQIASQLEQDLELSMDLSVPEDKPSKTKKKLGSRRRKRNDNSSNSSNSEPARVPTIEVAIEAKLPEPTHTVSDTTSSTTKKPSGSQRRSGRKRSSPSMEEETSQETQGSVESSQPAPKKRRSLRLRGRAIADKEIEAKSDDVVEPERERSEAAASLPEQATEAKGSAETEGARIEPERSDTPPPPESQAREQVSPGSSILQSLKAILGSLRNVSFGRSTLRELDDVMFDIKMEAHNAFKRSE